MGLKMKIWVEGGDLLLRKSWWARVPIKGNPGRGGKWLKILPPVRSTCLRKKECLFGSGNHVMMPYWNVCISYRKVLCQSTSSTPKDLWRKCFPVRWQSRYWHALEAGWQNLWSLLASAKSCCPYCVGKLCPHKQCDLNDKFCQSMQFIKKKQKKKQTYH